MNPKKLILFVILATLLHGCSNETSQRSLSYHMYVWNQLWTDDVFDAFQQWKPQLAGFHVLALTMDKNQRFKRIQLDPKALANVKETTFVIRINGHTLPSTTSLLTEVAYLQTAGLIKQNSRIEIDYDAPTSQLGTYAAWLQDLQSSIEIPLGITAIPTWSNSKDLRKLLDQLDYYVLQVHSVLSPEKGLFDQELALNWVKNFNQISDTPFLLSLPSYWYEGGFDRNNELQFLQAEQPQFISSYSSKEIYADPKELAKAINLIHALDLKHLTGIIWFRMPNESDQRTFSNQTLAHLMNGTYTWQDNLELHKVPISNTSSNYDFFLVNASEVDVVSQGNYSLAGCQQKHLINGVTAVDSILNITNKSVFRPGEKIRVGWGTCEGENK
ncbi:MAG: DUF3142 domain-containing protein [Xanthomonadales bacterium]|nr:DUF3142 domain-containing protein [Xanthomonadales bacterium]